MYNPGTRTYSDSCFVSLNPHLKNKDMNYKVTKVMSYCDSIKSQNKIE